MFGFLHANRNIKETLDFNDVASLQLQFFRKTLRDLHE